MRTHAACNALASRLSDTKFRSKRLHSFAFIQSVGLAFMNQPSEERSSDDVVPFAPKATVLPFERPQSELQKAVQQRAQETIDRERDRAARAKPAPWRRALVLALAAIPVFITFGAAIGFVGALRQFNSAIFDSDSKSGSQAPANQNMSPAPAANAEPDVVLLQPYSIPSPARQDDGKSTVTAPRP